MTSVPRTAWITGASQGIGRALAMKMAGHDRVQVAASARGDADLQQMAAPGPVLCGDSMAEGLLRSGIHCGGKHVGPMLRCERSQSSGEWDASGNGSG